MAATGQAMALGNLARLLLGAAGLFMGALLLILLALMLGVYGLLQQMPSLLSLSALMETVAAHLLAVALALGGGLSVAGLAASTLNARLPAIKAKNDAVAHDSAHEREKVKALLNSLTFEERRLLRERLAASRLRIRDDGKLIPAEQALRLAKVDRFISP